MFRFLRLIFALVRRSFRSRRDLLMENLVLRQQLSALKRRNPRQRVTAIDKLFLVLTRRIWSGWKQSLILVSPETVVRWRRTGFQLYWRLISRAKKPVGRHRISKEIRELIFQMVAEKPTWGAPRIHGELLMLGFLMSASKRSPAGCAGRLKIPSQPSAGSLSCAIIGKPSPPWTSSQFQRLHSIYFTASS